VFVRKGLVGACAFFALVLLASFYSVGSGAVDRAARQRFSGAEGVGSAARSAAPSPSARSNRMLARAGG
jgi:hypothetical protein